LPFAAQQLCWHPIRSTLSGWLNGPFASELLEQLSAPPAGRRTRQRQREGKVREGALKQMALAGGGALGLSLTIGHELRRLLLVAAVLALSTLVLSVPPLGAREVVVGAYYYPWYGPFAGGHDLRQSLRGHLVPPQRPAIGFYDSRDRRTIAAHIDQSHRGNIDFWAVSWWGPNSAEDATFRKSILAHPRRAELKYAVHYESTGRLGDPSTPDFANLVPDFRYLARHYFANPDYLKHDGRPVVFMYVTRAYFNSPSARDAVAALRSTMQSEFGVNPFLVGDDLFQGGVDRKRARLWDAVTDFDVYGTVLQSGGSTSAALVELARIYDDARAAIAPLEVAFVPTASPGFNDKGVRGGHPSAPRYLIDESKPRSGDLFERMLRDVAVPRTDPQAGNILMINSFNEWHEDTQVEPAANAARTKVDDSGQGRFTEGHFYEGYGEKYLKILRSATAAHSPVRPPRPE
jgi:glycoprotein endo-alpha-1,2-mannosidase